ncbi:unnamed protein product, partial [Iphiclides podalirius]
MSFGLRNAGQTFQRFIDEILRGLDFAFPYIDDILVFSRDAEEHAKHLRIILQRLVDYGVVFNVDKCVLGTCEVIFLGYKITKDGICPPEEKIAALRELSLPKTAQGLRRFLGMGCTRTPPALMSALPYSKGLIKAGSRWHSLAKS